MGKKSLIKSTSKKKRAPKKAAPAANLKKKAPAKKAAPAKPKPAAKAKPVPKPAKKAAPKTKPVSVKDLLRKKFDIVTPKVLYTVPKKKVAEPTFTAPAFLTGFKAEDAKRVKGLLANSYTEKDLIEATKKATTEKAAAEKAAAEKAAAEKAAAEKAAAEKAAAEKAAAEKAAAEKAEEIKKAAAQKPDVSVSYEPTPEQAAAKKPSDPVDNTMKIFAAGLAFLILLVIGGSVSNSFKYYLTENQGALEVWKGKFSPIGKKLVIALPGVPAPEDPKATYRSGDVYPIVFQYYIDKADVLLDVPGIPDFEGIKATLKTALEYGSTNALRALAYQRLDNIDRLILTYKADVAASRGTIDDLKAAIGFLSAADKLTTDKAQEELIARTISAHEAAITALEEQAAAEQTAAEAEAEAPTAQQAEDTPEVEGSDEHPEPASDQN
jgi:hypothetical protein